MAQRDPRTRPGRPADDRRRPRRAARALVAAAASRGCCCSATTTRCSRSARSRQRPFAVADGQGHRSRRVRHEGRHRAGDPRHRRARRPVRRRDAVHRRRGGRLRRVARADRGAGASRAARARARAERRRRRAEDRPQGHRHVRGHRPRPRRARRPRAGEGRQRAGRGRPPGAGDQPSSATPTVGHDGDADGRAAPAPPTTSCPPRRASASTCGSSRPARRQRVEARWPRCHAGRCQAPTIEVHRRHQPPADARVGVGRRCSPLAAAASMPGTRRRVAVGGGSDGNFTAALGVPTLDGLGAVGGGAHADHEHVDRRHDARTSPPRSPAIVCRRPSLA